MKKLTDFEIARKLESLEDWDFYDNALHTDFEFDNFKDCMSAMNRIAFECEALNHHPEWTNIYNTLDIKLTTHDANGVTLLDFKLASIINQIVEVKEDEPEG
ncbi:MAG: 4a-hydroxytetrahydrobiopterin dehydratase [Flavobacteriales bacterium]|jgi:4a-hydroxytetrahydrobiopterin dehydratase|tara:strand:- start:109 stop:414 length:306 start_codon:yes stop_codon:yes gene_type:complete